MGKVDRLRNTVEPFAALFWALGIVCTCQHLTLPAGPASLNAVQKACPYMVIVGSILKVDAKTRRLPPLFYLGYLSMLIVMVVVLLLLLVFVA